MQGRQKRKNQIVNSVAPRDVSYGGNIKPKIATIERVLSNTQSKPKTIRDNGINKTAMMANLGAYFELGVRSGDCWEGVDCPSK